MDHFDKIIQLLKKGTIHPVDEKVWDKVAKQLPPQRRNGPFPWWLPLVGLMAIVAAGGLGYWLGFRSHQTSGASGQSVNTGEDMRTASLQQWLHDTILIHDTLYLSPNMALNNRKLEDPDFNNDQIASIRRQLGTLQFQLTQKDNQLAAMHQTLLANEENSRFQNQQENVDATIPSGILSVSEPSLPAHQEQNAAESASRFAALGPLPSLSIYPNRNHKLHAPPYMVKTIEPKVHSKFLPESYRLGFQYGVLALPQEHEIGGTKEYAGGINVELIFSKHFSFISGAGLRIFKGSLHDHEHEYLQNYPASQINDPELSLNELSISKQYFEIPLMVKYAYNFNNDYRWRPYVSGGPLLTHSNGQEFRFEYEGNGREVYDIIQIPANKLALNTLLGQIGIEFNPAYHLSTFADFSFRYQFELSKYEYGYLHGVTLRMGAQYEF